MKKIVNGKIVEKTSTGKTLTFKDKDSYRKWITFVSIHKKLGKI